MKRIDVHQHLLPPPYADWLRSEGVRDAGGGALPAGSVDDALALRDGPDIATAILSVSTPGVHLHPGREREPVARAKAREVDEFAANVVARHPRRFGFFATLAFAAPGHVRFGSDWPYAPPIAVRYFTAQLDAYAPLGRAGHEAIDRGSAEASWPRLASTTPQERA